jgi:pyruvate-formate lyase-activating enzyme
MDDFESNEWNHYSTVLNDEFGGKTLFHCAALNGGGFGVTPGMLKICGSATHKAGSPNICEYLKPDVEPRDFLMGLAGIIRRNQEEDGPCVGCRYLIKTQLSDKFVASRFSAISLHDFCGCNSKCIYCSGSEYFLPQKYIASFDHEILFRNLLQRGLVKPDSMHVDWGGGEPSLLRSFERTVDFLRTAHIRQTINTSGIKFSPATERALKEQLATVRISVDSGTDETYTVVKGNCNSRLVWTSVKKYAATGGNFIVKYIVLPENSKPFEVENFVLRCRDAGTKKICISVDARLVYSTGYDRRVTIKEMTAAALMFHLSIINGIEPYFESIWPPEHIRKIEKICRYYRWRTRIVDLPKMALERVRYGLLSLTGAKNKSNEVNRK